MGNVHLFSICSRSLYVVGTYEWITRRYSYGWLDRKKKVFRRSISSSSSTYDSVMDGRPSTRGFVLGNPLIYVGREIDKLLVTIIQNCTLLRWLVFDCYRTEQEEENCFIPPRYRSIYYICLPASMNPQQSSRLLSMMLIEIRLQKLWPEREDLM